VKQQVPITESQIQYLCQARAIYFIICLLKKPASFYWFYQPLQWYDKWQRRADSRFSAAAV